MDILIKNIKKLAGLFPAEVRKVSGNDMSVLPFMDNAFLLIRKGKIESFGSMKEFESISNEIPQGLKIVDADGKTVLPCWCDSHTHLVYAGSRELEFVDKIKGMTYEEIAKNGGGILNSAKKLNNTSEVDLTEQALWRLNEISSFGTGAVEIKSGYGLTVEGELKMLRVIKKLKEKSPLLIKSTFLGAHALPPEYKENRKGYLQLLIRDMLPVIAAEGLADFIDVFCDKGFFTSDETEEILEAGYKYGLRPKIHANELDFSGGIQAGVKHGALSVDHLEFTGDEEIAALLNSETMPTLLPSTAFFLRLKYPPARKMIDSGLPVSLASDYNPGSSPSGKMSFILSLACVNLRMTPEEAITAATINGAYAMGIESTHGSISKGKAGSIIITKKIPSLAYFPYSFGSDLIDTVIIDGKIIEN